MRTATRPSRTRACCAVLRRCMGAVALAVCLVVGPPLVGTAYAANVHYNAGHNGNEPIGGDTFFRGSRVFLTHSSASWTIPMQSTGSEWIGVCGTPCSLTNFYQIGYAKSNGPSIGSCGTSDSTAKVFVEAFHNGVETGCVFGQAVSDGEGHLLKVQRCVIGSGADSWCAYVDSSLVSGSGTIGQTLAAPLTTVEAAGEFNCNTLAQCDQGTGNQFIGASYGGTNDWTVTETGASCSCATWQDVGQADVTQIVAPDAASWVLDDVNKTGNWSIRWNGFQ